MRIIDIHTHGIGGYDTRTTAEGHIMKVADIQGFYGVSAILPTIYSGTPRVMRENMMMVRNAMEKQKSGVGSQESESGRQHLKKQDSGFRTQDSENPDRETRNPWPATILGVHLEGPFLNPSYCGALNAITFLQPSEYAFEGLIEGFEDIVRLITISPELDGAAGLIRKIAERGITVSMGHSDATYAEAEAGLRAGARGITHLFNAMRGFHHREPGLAGFGLLNPEVYAEVIADPYHLHPKTLDLIFRVKKPERLIIVSDSVREAKTVRKDDAITDGSGILLGGCMTVTESAKRLVEKGFNEELIGQCITRNPEAYLGGHPL